MRSQLVPKFGLVAGPLAYLFLALSGFPASLPQPGRVVLATALLMAVWWVTEAVPIPAASLIPLAVFPLGGVMKAGEVSVAYMDSNIVLFMGGFFLAMAIQRWALHRRIALSIIGLVGGSPSRLVLGFMAATAFISMWVSNTATAIMLLPIATAVVLQLREAGLSRESRFPIVLLLGVAYAASIGGVGTLIGTPPNLVFAAQYANLFPDRQPVGFGQWMGIGLPFVVLFLAFAWCYLTRFFARLTGDRLDSIEGVIAAEKSKLGPMNRGEWMVAAVFGLTSLGWIFRGDLQLGFATVPGWASLFGVAGLVNDSTVAIVCSLLLFSLPVDWRKRIFLLDWEWASRIPWGILLLFGGGIALARGFQQTGLDRWVGERLEVFAGLPTPLLVLMVCLTVSFMTELTSNVATAAIFMPILAGTAAAWQVEPLTLMVPAAISASCAFMLPVATPPNAIVFGSGWVTVPEMCRAGFWLNLVGAVLITTLYFLVGTSVFVTG